MPRIAGECGRPRTVTRLTSRQNSGSTAGRATTSERSTQNSGMKPYPEAGRDHRQDPVVPLAAVDHLHIRPVLAPDRSRIAVELAVDAVEIALAVKRAHRYRVELREPVLQVDHEHHLLAKERHVVKPIVFLVARQTIDRHVQFAVYQLLLQQPRLRIGELQLQPLMARVHGGDEIDEMPRRDGAHDSELEDAVFQAAEIAR